jgi:hypothetical protein
VGYVPRATSSPGLALRAANVRMLGRCVAVRPLGLSLLLLCVFCKYDSFRDHVGGDSEKVEDVVRRIPDLTD